VHFAEYLADCFYYLQACWFGGCHYEEFTLLAVRDPASRDHVSGCALPDEVAVGRLQLQVDERELPALGEGTVQLLAVDLAFGQEDLP
jgi:hypothetical protein